MLYRSNLFRILLGTLIVAFTAVSAAPNPATMYCDEPGTPNNESAVSTAPRTITYSFDNTARISPSSHPNGPLKMIMFFDINMKEAGTNQDWTYIENDGPHNLGYKERQEYRITTQETRHINPANLRQDHVDHPLLPNHTYCLRVWSRVTGGCRSQSSSSWKCAKVMP